MLAVSAIVLSRQSTNSVIATAQAQDPRVEKIKHQRREERYSDKNYPAAVRSEGAPVSEALDGTVFNYTIYHWADDHDYNDVATRNAFQVKAQARRKQIVCESNLIVRGEVEQAQSVIHGDDQFIYSIYNFVITEVYRSSASKPINAGDKIELTGPGGTVILGTRRLRYLYPAIDQLQSKQEYVLHMQYDPEAGDFYLISSQGIYTLQDGAATRADTLRDDYHARLGKVEDMPRTATAIKDAILATNCK